MKSGALFLYAMLACVQPIQAQITGIVGFVRDSVTGSAIPGALLSLKGHGYALTAASGDDGSFRFSRISPGTYTVTARRLGYAPLEMPIPVEENGVQLNIRLVRVTTLPPIAALPGTGIVGEAGAMQSLAPIPNAEIQVVGTGTRIQADSLGRFFVPLKTPGTYIVRARSGGFTGQAVSVVVARDSTVKVMLLLDSLSSERSNAYEIAWRDFGDRVRLRGPRSALISHVELKKTGEPGLLEALQRVPSLSTKQLRFGPIVCVFVDGRPEAGPPIRSWGIDQVEAVEVYTADGNSDVSGSLQRGSRGYECQPTELPTTIPVRRDRIRWLVIWVKR